jgi:hypothetical protein
MCIRRVPSPALCWKKRENQRVCERHPLFDDGDEIFEWKRPDRPCVPFSGGARDVIL